MSEKIPQEIIESEFNRFCEEWDIDNEVDRMTAEDAEDFASIKNQITRYMEDQRIELTEDAKMRVYLRFSNQIERDCLELDVSRLDIMVTDRHGDSKNAHKLNAVASEGCGIPERLYAKVDPRDKKVVTKVVNLFLGS